MIDISCENCVNNEDGFCDFLGKLIQEDDKPGDKCSFRGFENKIDAGKDGRYNDQQRNL